MTSHRKHRIFCAPADFNIHQRSHPRLVCFGPAQHDFAMASVDVPLAKADSIWTDLIEACPAEVLGPSAMLLDERRRAAVAHALGRIDGRYRVTLVDKRGELAHLLFEELLLQPMSTPAPRSEVAAVCSGRAASRGARGRPRRKDGAGKYV